MEIKCELCGEKIVVADDLVPGQHVRCPFCGGKFSYAVKRKEITEDDLREAIAICRKNDEWNKYYKNAPAGAKLYIALVFYGKVFADTLDKAAFVEAFKEIGPNLKERDLRYLLQYEDDEAMREYLSDRLASVCGDTFEMDGHVPAPKPSQARPAGGAAASQCVAKPVRVMRLRKNATSDASTRMNARGQTNWSGAVAAVAVALAVACFGIFLYRVWIERQTEEESAQIAESARRKAVEDKREQLNGCVDNARRKANELQQKLTLAVTAMDNDKARFKTEITKIEHENNLRAGSAQANGRMRFNAAELAMAILNSPIFEDIYKRYTGQSFAGKAAEAKSRILAEIGGRSNFTKNEVDGIDVIGNAYVQSADKEIRNALITGSKEIAALKVEVRKLQGIVQDADDVAKGSDADQMETAMAKLQELRYAEVENRLERLTVSPVNSLAAEMSKDVFSLDGVRSKEAVAGVVGDMLKENGVNLEQFERLDQEAKRCIVEEVQHDRQMRFQKFGPNSGETNGVARSMVQENPPQEDVPMDASGKGKPSFAKRPRARTKCKSPDRCVEFAEEGQNFCPKHKCQSYGCKQHIATLSVPSWVDYDKYNQLTSVSKKKEFRKLPSRFCKDHMCKRVVPQINDRKIGGRDSWYEFQRIIEDDRMNFAFFYCPNERMASGRFCEEHACKVPSCRSDKWEYWVEGAASEVTRWDIERNSTRDTHSFKGMKLISGETCKGHSAKDPATIPERTEAQKMTCSDRMRAKERKR